LRFRVGWTSAHNNEQIPIGAPNTGGVAAVFDTYLAVSHKQCRIGDIVTVEG